MVHVFVTGGLGFIGALSRMPRRSPQCCTPTASLGVLRPDTPGATATAASHTVLVLLEHGHSVVMIDNLSNSFLRVYDHMKRLAGDKADRMEFVQVSSPPGRAAVLAAAQRQRQQRRRRRLHRRPCRRSMHARSCQRRPQQQHRVHAVAHAFLQRQQQRTPNARPTLACLRALPAPARRPTCATSP